MNEQNQGQTNTNNTQNNAGQAQPQNQPQQQQKPEQQVHQPKQAQQPQEPEYDPEIEAMLKKPGQYRDYLLKIMIENNASDMFLTVNEPPALRIYGNIYRIKQLPPFTSDSISEVAYMFLDDTEGEKFRAENDIDIGWSYAGRRFRLNISRQQKTIMVVIRLLAKDIPTIDGYKLPQIFKKLVKTKSGIILMAGPTGSGKSSTLAAMIQEINMNYQKHIITIEDPVEYVFQPDKCIIEQKQLGIDVNTYAKALRAALRQNPDVCLFGEMRDQESIENALTLAETGHLVISTIHSKSSSQTVNKIIDSFPADKQNQIRIQLAETLVAIVSQRLLRKKSGDGLIASYEIMIKNSAIANLIRENQISQIKNIIQTSKVAGMCLLEESLIELVELGEIDLEAATMVANDPKYVINEVKNRGGG